MTDILDEIRRLPDSEKLIPYLTEVITTAQMRIDMFRSSCAHTFTTAGGTIKCLKCGLFDIPICDDGNSPCEGRWFCVKCRRTMFPLILENGLRVRIKVD